MKIFTIRNILIFLLIVLGVLRYTFFIESAELLILFIRLLLYDFDFASGQVSFQLLDTLISLLLAAGILQFLLFSRRAKWLSRKVTFRPVVIIILGFFFFLAPAVSNFHPEFHKNLSLTRFLPPLSYIKTFHKKSEEPASLVEQFMQKKNSVVKEPVNENIIFIETPVSGELHGKGVIKKTIFLFGTDQYGRDIFSRLVYGARISLLVGSGAVIISFLMGFVLGFAAGYPGGIIDIILNRIADIFLSFPVIFLIILVLALFGNSLFTVIAVLGFSGWMSMFKVVRGEVIGIKKKEYFLSAKRTGATFYELMFKEALPVIAVPVVVNLIFQFANVIIAEAALSYLGLGAGVNYPSWGSMINSAQGYLTEAWWMIIAPGVLLIITLFTAYDTGKNYNQKILRRAND